MKKNKLSRLILLTLLHNSPALSQSEDQLTITTNIRNFDKDLNYYDPLNMGGRHQITFGNALFSRLLTEDMHGNRIPDLAESYQIDKNSDLIFKLRKNIKTMSGHGITSEDVVFSLKRAMTSNLVNIQPFKSSIAQCEKLKNAYDTCLGITAIDEFTVKISPKDNVEKVLQFLVETEFSILVKDSVNKDTNKIVDFKNVTGSYYFSGLDKEGFPILLANKNHYQYHPKMPQKIYFRGHLKGDKDYKHDIVTEFKSGKINHINKLEDISEEDRADLMKDKNVNSMFSTKSSIRYFYFTEKALKDFSPLQRFYIATNVRKLLYENLGIPESKQAQQFLPENLVGSLSEEQLEIYRQKMIHAEKIKTGPIYLPLLEVTQEKLKGKFKTLLPELIMTSSQNEVNLENAHIRFRGASLFGTSAFMLSQWLAENSNFIGTSDESKNWLNSINKFKTEQEYNAELKKKHFEALVTNPTVVPYVIEDVSAFIKKPWVLNYSKDNVESPFAALRYKD